MSLVSMGTFLNDIPLMDAIINSFNNDNMTVTMMVHVKHILLSVKPFDVCRLIGLLYKDAKELINTKEALLNHKNKIHLEKNHRIFIEYLIGERIFSLLSLLLIY